MIGDGILGCGWLMSWCISCSLAYSKGIIEVAWINFCKRRGKMRNIQREYEVEIIL